MELATEPVVSVIERLSHPDSYANGHCIHIQPPHQKHVDIELLGT